MRLTLALAALMITTPVWASPDGFIDPSNATLKTGKLSLESDNTASVNFTITNNSDKTITFAAVACTALVNDDPVETNYALPSGIAPGQKAYSSVNFLKLRGKVATASCRVEYIRID